MAVMCKDCLVKWAQEMGLCRGCQRKRLTVDTPETRRCAQCQLTQPHTRCRFNVGHSDPHSFEPVSRPSGEQK